MITTFDITKGHIRPGISYRHSHNLEICMCACLCFYLLAFRGSGALKAGISLRRPKFKLRPELWDLWRKKWHCDGVFSCR